MTCTPAGLSPVQSHTSRIHSIMLLLLSLRASQNRLSWDFCLSLLFFLLSHFSGWNIPKTILAFSSSPECKGPNACLLGTNDSLGAQSRDYQRIMRITRVLEIKLQQGLRKGYWLPRARSKEDSWKAGWEWIHTSIGFIFRNRNSFSFRTQNLKADKLQNEHRHLFTLSSIFVNSAVQPCSSKA